jgi:hypothetical protein
LYALFPLLEASSPLEALSLINSTAFGWKFGWRILKKISNRHPVLEGDEKHTVHGASNREKYSMVFNYGWHHLQTQVTGFSNREKYSIVLNYGKHQVFLTLTVSWDSFLPFSLLIDIMA